MTFFLGDRERLARFRAGDRPVLADVYRHYVGDVARVLRAGFAVRTPEGLVRIEGLDSAFDVECGCHEVFMRAFQPGAREAYDGMRPYRNYLFRIARNWRIDQFRRRHAMTSIEEVDDIEATLPDLDETLAQRQLTGLVERYLEAVPERDRAYFRARFRDGAGQTDAAAALGLTRIQGRRIEARLKEGLLGFLRRHGHGERP